MWTVLSQTWLSAEHFLSCAYSRFIGNTILNCDESHENDNKLENSTQEKKLRYHIQFFVFLQV